MNQNVTVITLEDNKNYVVLDKIIIDDKSYLILALEDNPKLIIAVAFLEESKSVEPIKNQEILNQVLKEFASKHPEFLKNA